MFVGALIGRFVCGWLCPFGLIQDLLHKIPFSKKITSFRGDRILRKLKYLILIVFVILLPMFLVDILGQGAPYFCKLICPAGTLEGGIPLVLLNQSLRSALGWLYVWKNVLLLITIVLLAYGTIQWGWYFNEIAGLFFGLAIVSAIIGGMSVNEFAESISNGMTGICGGALVCGFARGIMVVLTDGNIIHTLLHATANILMQLPSVISAVGMYIFQCLLNFIIPSGSGQAAVSMPIMAPLADMVGVTRQTATLAFQLGDGISNIFTPTSGYFMAALALAKIPWEKWARWILPLIGIQYLLGAILVVIAHLMQWGPF